MRGVTTIGWDENWFSQLKGRSSVALCFLRTFTSFTVGPPVCWPVAFATGVALYLLRTRRRFSRSTFRYSPEKPTPRCSKHGNSRKPRAVQYEEKRAQIRGPWGLRLWGDTVPRGTRGEVFETSLSSSYVMATP